MSYGSAKSSSSVSDPSSSGSNGPICMDIYGDGIDGLGQGTDVPGWQNTGLAIAFGQNVLIEAETGLAGGWSHGTEYGGGTYYYGPLGFADPQEDPDPFPPGYFTLLEGGLYYRVSTGTMLDADTDQVIGRLIGRIGVDGVPFSVGLGVSLSGVTEEGDLYLALNDTLTASDNNLSYIHACVTISEP